MVRGIKRVDTIPGRTSEENTIAEVFVDVNSIKDAVERFEIRDSGAHHVESLRAEDHTNGPITKEELDDGPTEAAVRAILSNTTSDAVYVDGVRVAGLTVNL